MRSTLESLNWFAQQIAEHADLAELRSRGFDDFESLKGVDRSRFNSYMHALFRNVEDVYYQHLEGHLDPHLWRGLEVVVREVNTYPGVQTWWRSHSHWFGGEEFAKFINEQQQTAKPPKSYREPNTDPSSNQSMKPTAPLRSKFSVFATTPCRGLSPSREIHY